MVQVFLIHRKDAEDAENNDWFKSSDLPAAGRLEPSVCSPALREAGFPLPILSSMSF